MADVVIGHFFVRNVLAHIKAFTRDIGRSGRLIRYRVAFRAEALADIFGGLPDRCKRIESAVAKWVPAYLFDRRVEKPFVRRKLLHRADTAAGPNDSDKVARLHLFVDELAKRPHA